MKLQVVSDLHLEFSAWHLPEVESDIIICAGDIAVGSNGVNWALKESKRLNKPIIYVMGNHEFYNHDYNTLLNEVKVLTKDTNVHVLDNDEFVYDDVRFLGSTLWTDFAISGDAIVGKLSAGSFLNDFRLIKHPDNFTPDFVEQLHIDAKLWLQTKLSEKFDGKTVVVTHHGMCTYSQNPQFPINHVSGCFWSDLENFFFDYDMNMWIFGHTHHSVTEEINNTKIISNQRGYVRHTQAENTNFVNNYTVSV